MLHVICVLETVRGAVRRLQKISNSAFEYDYYYYYYYYVVVETKTSLKVVRARLKTYILKIKNATLCSLPWTQVANFISKVKIFCCYVPATALSTTNYRDHPSKTVTYANISPKMVNPTDIAGERRRRKRKRRKRRRMRMT